ELVKSRNGTRLHAHRNHTIDAAFVMSRSQIKLLLPLLGNPFRMLDDLAIHVRDPETAVRPGLDHRGPEPVVARSEKLRLLLARRPATAKRHSLRRHNLAMNQVVDRLADKGPCR